MKKPKINPAVIGVFIAGAIVIFFTSIIVFGSGRLFTKTKEMLLTFREPVAGLDAGAPVKLLGVTVGSVKEIYLQPAEDPTQGILINVIIEIDRKKAQSMFREYRLDFDNPARFERMINERGLRGQLDVLSLVSGQLYIALNLFPGEQGFQLHKENETGLWEIPTLPSAKRAMLQSVAKTLSSLAEFDFKGVSDELKPAIAKLNESLGQLRDLGAKLNGKIDPLLTQAETDLKKAESTLDSATTTLRNLQTQVEPGSALSSELIRTLDQTSEAMSALRQLAEELQRDPSLLISGKRPNKP